MSQQQRAIASMWIGAPLSYIEVVCLKSFADRGHPVTLYTLEPPSHVPEGVTLADAREIFAPTFPVGPKLRHNNAVYADIFRLHLLQARDVIWADADAYCLREFTMEARHVFAFERHKGEESIANGVLGLPKTSPTLQLCLDFVAQEAPIPPYFPQGEQDRLRKLRDSGTSWGIEALTWGASGPMLVDHFLRQTGEIAHAMSPDTLYPGPRPFRRPLLRVPPDLDRLETPQTLSVHIFGKTKRFLLAEHDGLPPKGSYLDLICQRHGVDPHAFPIPAEELQNIEREKV